MLENPETRFGQSRTDLGLKMVPMCFTCVLNCGLRCFEAENGHRFGSKEVEPRLMRGLSMDSPHTVFWGLLKTILNCMLDRKRPCEFA